MQQTTNYNLLIPEGTDVVNPLTQVNPNFQTIDSAMFANKQATIGTAAEVVTGTIHAIIRNNADSDVFRFTATGAWTAGDTMTLDGQQVTVHLSDGTTPATNSYIIGAEVLAMVNGSLVTLAISSAPPAQGVTSFNNRTGAVVPTASDYDGSMIDYDNTTSGLNSTDVQGAIDEVNAATKHGLYEAWYNTTPNLAFTAQTITVNVPTGTDAVCLLHEVYKGEKYGSKFDMLDLSYISSGEIITLRTAEIIQGNLQYAARQVTGSLSGNVLSLTFADATVGSSTNNDYMLPLRILTLSHNS